MTVRVGVVGTGMIGQDHIRRLTRVLSGAAVVAVTDIDTARAEQVAMALPAVTVHHTGHDLIGDDRVEAVLVTSWGSTHEEHILAAIKAGKPVFCEKPLAPTEAACKRIVDAEMACGRRLVQVGFMRRYDPAYRALKAVLDSGEIGVPLMMHCAHRNASAPPYGFTSEMLVTDSAVHEIDLVQWLFGEKVAATTVLKPRSCSRGGGRLQDPLVLLLEMTSGVLVDVEVFVNAGYGYDIRAEIVGEDGTAALPASTSVTLRRGGQRSEHVPADWRERFGPAFDAEFEDWLSAVARGGGRMGADSWDGYAATVVAESCVKALRTGHRTLVSMPDRPAFYAKAH